VVDFAPQIITNKLFRIDIATTREEDYTEPGALPRITVSSIRKDLFRRDFTINAIATSLNKNDFGKIIDNYGGQRDIKEKKLRILHTLSFIDDPTRMIRAIKFEKRFGFKIEPFTLKLLKFSLSSGYLGKVSGKRIFQELKSILNLKLPLNCIERLFELNIMQNIHSKFVYDEFIKSMLLNAYETINWYKLLFIEKKIDIWILYFSILTLRFNYNELSDIIHKFNISQKIAVKIEQIHLKYKVIYDKLKTIKKQSNIFFLLKPLHIETLLFLVSYAKYYEMDIGIEIEKKISHFFIELNDIKPLITGKDLIDRGYAPGIRIKKIKDKMLKIQIDKNIDDRKKLLKYLK
jgi:tRNA nucleotidyltransferase (CCA-adding enzyme)